MDGREAPVRLGVIGLGRGFMLTLPGLRAHPGIRLVAAADPRADARAAFTAEFSAPAYESAEELLADPEVEAVYIASPHELHAAQGIASARAGRHLLVEKPMATGLAEARALADAADRAGVVLLIGPSHGYDAPVLLAADQVSLGQHGRVRAVTAMNFTDFLYRFRRPEELDDARGGGVVHSQGAHQIDAVRRIVASPVRSVRAVAGNWDRARRSVGAYSALLTFDNGAVATLTYSGYGHFDSDALMGGVSELGYPKPGVEHGDARRRLAALATDEAQGKLARAYRKGAPRQETAPFHEHFGFMLVSCERADLELTPEGVWVNGDLERRFDRLPRPAITRAGVLDEFVAAIRGTTRPVQDGGWGVATVAVCEAIIRSSQRGEEVEIEP